MKLYDELKWRGLIKDEAGENLEEKIKRKNFKILNFFLFYYV